MIRWVLALALVGGALAACVGCDQSRVAARIVTGDYGWCAANGGCGNYAARYYEVVDCLGWPRYPTEEVPLPFPPPPPQPIPPPLMPTIIPPDETAWWGGECVWIACEVHPTGLCRGVTNWYSDGHYEIVLPEGDDLAYEHEVVHYLYRVVRGEEIDHWHAAFRECGPPRLTCDDVPTDPTGGGATWDALGWPD